MSNFKNNIGEDKKTVNAKFPYFILAICILITVAIAYNFYKSAQRKDSIRFNNEVTQTQFAIENKINLYVALLESGRGFIKSSSELNNEAFAAYVENLSIRKSYPELKSFGYSRVVQKNTVPAVGSSQAADLNRPDSNAVVENQNLFFPNVLFVKPNSDETSDIKSFDVNTAELLRLAFEQARNSGSPVISSKLKIYKTDDRAELDVFFIVLPIYQPAEANTASAPKDKNISGYILGAVAANDFLAEIRKSIGSESIGVMIYENEIRAENLLAGSGSAVAGKNSAASGNFSTVAQINAGGKKWITVYRSLPAFAEESSIGWTLLVILTGVFFSFLLFSIIYTEVSARINFQQSAAKLMEMQNQKQILLEKEQSARKSAERANRAKDEFIAVVSHELKTPLNAISGWTNILQTDDLPEQTKQLALEKIWKNLHIQTALVEEILEYSQIISGTVDLNRRKINFCEIFENIFVEYEQKALEKNIRLIKESRSTEYNILGDDQKIKLVIDNLFSNAIKFTEPGGRVNAIISEAEGNLQLCIKDTGNGISPEFLPYVFEKFRQADASITRSSGGLGLGLTITSHIVRLHQGTIEADSAGMGKGSAFTVKLPLMLHDA